MNQPKWPALDGLRGSAILAVLICHYATLFPQSMVAGVLVNGWAGVDLFFVLSGFLITGILLDSKDSPRYFRNFYARRILRTFPLYFGFLLILLLVLVVMRWRGRGASEGMNLLWSCQPSLWTYTFNYKFGFTQQWNEWADTVAPLWSLSIEEQFYLVWPLIVLCFSRRALLIICLGICAGALILRLILTARGVGYFPIYTMTPTRCDGLAAGAIVALLIRSPRGEHALRRWSTYIGVAAAVLILLGSRGFDPRNAFLRNVLYTNLAVFFASLLFWSIDPSALRGIPNRFYQLRLLRHTGTYSYGIYVLHLPILLLAKAALTRGGVPTWLIAPATIAIAAPTTFALAILSYHGFESRFLKLKRYFPRAAS